MLPEALAALITGGRHADPGSLTYMMLILAFAAGTVYLIRFAFLVHNPLPRIRAMSEAERINDPRWIGTLLAWIGLLALPAYGFAKTTEMLLTAYLPEAALRPTLETITQPASAVAVTALVFVWLWMDRRQRMSRPEAADAP